MALNCSRRRPQSQRGCTFNRSDPQYLSSTCGVFKLDWQLCHPSPSSSSSYLFVVVWHTVCENNFCYLKVSVILDGKFCGFVIFGNFALISTFYLALSGIERWRSAVGRRVEFGGKFLTMLSGSDKSFQKLGSAS